MIRRAARHEPSELLEPFRQIRSLFASYPIELFELFELNTGDGCMHFAQPVVATHYVLAIIPQIVQHYFAVVTDQLSTISELIVIRDQDAAFATLYYFMHVQAEYPDVSDRGQEFPAISSAWPLSIILDDFQTILVRDFSQLIIICRAAKDVDCDDSFSPRCDIAMHGFRIDAI